MNNRDRGIPSQRTQMSKETKRTVSWLERQFTTKASRDYDSSNSVDYPTAVAVAAFVVKSIEDKSNKDQTKINIGADKPLSNIKSKANDTIERPEKSTAVTAAKSSSKVPDKNVVIRTATLNQEPLNSTRSLKQSATFEDNKKNSTFKNIDIASAKTPIRLSMSQKEMTKGTTTTTDHVVGNSKANIWENEEMKKIKERYEKQHNVILDWETKKKKKSKRHLEQIEAKLDRRRAMTKQSFYNDIGRIEKIAGGAKAKAEQNQEKEEHKVKERANKIRSTGKMPATCLCF
ncbi:remorin 1.4-like [Solanum pennellii]|uniref:Remorin 1.4-like n=1 Tax=Solanum pennellii TaxID=28526 RepID=A0ABM1V9D0_SOLPN|nr:remorin 1.4-like [Solanum pennellii]XP_027772347.1 remorin 1.4-like [Solanum pennellii]XP_027772348.1 remorin 1.4-like [Solanum pennellii]